MKKKKNMTVAIVAAAGSGKRLKSRTDKPFVKINGIPLVIHTLRIFDRTRSVDQVILAVDPKHVSKFGAMLKEYGIKKVVRIVAGGKTRQASVYNALKSAEDSAIVIVHDCARPFTGVSLVEKTIRTAKRCGGAIAAERARDTIKRVGAGGIIDDTLNRKIIWCAQTPQVFRFADLVAAYERAGVKNIKATDDSFLIEIFGGKVKVVESGSCNMKITTKDDLLYAENILRQKTTD
ncbi:2-C-methyl-D-erythritol 4-phosphate cytidylyltransferase [Candidatus Auribacterota bacterium]